MNFKIGQIYCAHFTSYDNYTFLVTSVSPNRIAIVFLYGRTFGSNAKPGDFRTLSPTSIAASNAKLLYETDATSYEDLKSRYPELLL